MKLSLQSMLGFSLSASCWVFAQAGVLPGPVVSTQWLAEHLDQVQVVEVRSNLKSFAAQPEFETKAKTGQKVLLDVGGRIPDSRPLDFKSLRADRMVGDLKVKYLLPDRAAFEKTIQAAGIDAGKPLVFVPVGGDTADVDEALRAYWQFKVYGEDDMAVLDGGMTAWLSEGRAHTVAAAPVKVGTWVAKADRSAQLLATSDDVAAASQSKAQQLIDARDLRGFHGLGKRDYVYAYGHIESAKSYEPQLLLKGGTAMGQKFYAPVTYKALMTAQGLDPAAPAITYCNSGHLAAGPWFVASEILGNKSVKLYDGSMHQWTLEKRPVVGAVPMQ